jgi:DNA replication and repair protein RecF
MLIEQLSIEHFRNIQHAEIEPAPGLNLIIGLNAAGKTSLLEAIDCLSRGRSFRTREIRSLLSHGQERCVLVGRLRTAMGSGVVLGMERSSQQRRMRMDGRAVDSVAEFAAALPVLCMHPQSHALIQGGPGNRRGFLDWGVFHVEPRFLKSWQRYRRALKQRNRSLRDPEARRMIPAWDGELSEAATVIDRAREAFLEGYRPILTRCVEGLLPAGDLALRYERGWPAGQDLAAVLQGDCEGDRRQGYTRSGPHRADLRIRLAGHRAAEVASRGQQKLLVAAMLLAQVEKFARDRGEPCAFLMDDLPSELDAAHRGRFLKLLAGLDVQVFVTAIEAGDLALGQWSARKVFHVKQGCVEELV